jgi:ADP-heptose:LPS heptosyltransferase
MTQRAFPILFITATRIGDAVLSSGLIKMLADQIPNARFTIVAGPLAAPLFAHVPGLDRVIVMEKGKGKGHWFKLWRQVRHKKWSLVVDLRGSATALFLRRDKRAIWKKLPGDVVHKVVDAARTLKLEGDPPAPYLYISPEVQALADELLGDGGPILAMGPASNWIGKVWPIERFTQTAAQLLDKDGPMAGGRLLILGGPEDTRMVEELRMASARGRTIDLTGKVDLLTAYACLRRARLFIGNDSGLMHIAAAAGAPTIGLFGPSDERRYGPWGDKAEAVRGPRTFDQFLAIDPDLSQAIRHMSDLPVATVVKAAKALLARTEPDAGVSPEQVVVEEAIAEEAAGVEEAPLAEVVAPEPVVETGEEVSREEEVVEEAVAEDRELEDAAPSTAHPRESGDPS